MAATQQDYDDLAAEYEYLASLLVQANARADMLGLTTPVTVADVLTFAAHVRGMGVWRAGTQPNPEETP